MHPAEQANKPLPGPSSPAEAAPAVAQKNFSTSPENLVDDDTKTADWPVVRLHPRAKERLTAALAQIFPAKRDRPSLMVAQSQILHAALDLVFSDADQLELPALLAHFRQRLGKVSLKEWDDQYNTEIQQIRARLDALERTREKYPEATEDLPATAAHLYHPDPAEIPRAAETPPEPK